MPTLATSQLLPPKSWDEFEDICADLFALEWGDRNVVRHGRQGQRQSAVDIYGRNSQGGYVGVQCKGKRRWPPANLTSREIDEEVGAALKFHPPLAQLIFATTALDDAATQAHARAITERHEQGGLFSVHVFGWAELTRRLVNHPELARKYFGQLLRETTGSLRHPEIHGTQDFIGREELLSTLYATHFDEAGGVRSASWPIAILGLGGIGKTTLAREFAWRNRERYAGIWWLRADTVENIVLGLVDLGERLPGGPGAPSESTFNERSRIAKRVLGVLASAPFSGPWLLIYDDADSPLAVKEWLPWTGAHVLCTTRWSSDWHGVATELRLDIFPPEDAVRFLEVRAARKNGPGATELANELGYLPLALDQAGAYCKETLMAFGDYRAKVSELIRRAPKTTSYPTSVFATFDLCIAKAAENAPQAQTLMGILAVLAPERIPIDVIHEGCMSVLDRGEAVAALLRVSLVNAEIIESGRAHIRVHRLVQLVMRDRLVVLGAMADALATAMLLLAKAFPIEDKSKYWPRCGELTPHAIAVLPDAPTFLDGFDDEGWLAHRRGQLDERVSRYRESLASKEQFDAMMTYEDNRRSAEFLAKALPQYKAEFQRKFLRRALEQPNNPNLQPLRDALNLYPSSAQREMRATAELALHMTAMLRDLMIRRDFDTIRKLVADHLDDFPVHLQQDLKSGFGERGSDNILMTMMVIGDAHKSLRQSLGIERPMLEPPKAKPRAKEDRWRRLVRWMTGSDDRHGE